MGRHDFFQGCLTAKSRYGIPDISFFHTQRSSILQAQKSLTKISCGQVDMTFVKAAIQLQVVVGFLTSDFSHTRELYTLYIHHYVPFFL